MSDPSAQHTAAPHTTANAFASTYEMRHAPHFASTIDKSRPTVAVPHRDLTTLDATRAAGLARLADFVPRAGRSYAGERNFDRGHQDRLNVSTLSPWARHRLVTEREVVESVLERHSLAVATRVVNTCYSGQGR